MPTVAVDKADLFELLGREFTTQEFDDLCFEFGIELDEDTTNDCLPGEKPQLKIDIPANRYDLLCIEGIAQSLNEFLHQKSTPTYSYLLDKPNFTLTIDESTQSIRPYAAAAILRNIKFTQKIYDSFITLQDKLHSNLCRNRTLVAIGTHDLDKLLPNFHYRASKPIDISFIPLNQSQVVNGESFIEFYQKDKNLGKFLHIIENSDKFPLILDSRDNIASLPPIINSNLSKITLDTKNVFIELTGTDKTKIEIVLNQLIAMFSRYSESNPFQVEQIQIISNHNNQSRITPNLSIREMPCEIDYVNRCLGLNLTSDQICQLLIKMSLSGEQSSSDPNIINVKIPITRPDILHQCDIMEDVGIAYGYNNLIKSRKADTELNSVAITGSLLPISKVTDIIRIANSQSSWSEVMPLTLCSHDENFKFLNRVDNNDLAVKLANPKTFEYQVVRTSLLPGLLKTTRENQKHSLPIKIFEVGDIVLKNDKLERRALNQRNWCAIYAGKNSGFEIIQGLLDKIMETMRSPWIENPDQDTTSRGYWIEGNDDDKNMKKKYTKDSLILFHF
ncbi:phenylalanine--tRNA ligase subunit beta [Ascoidea rubescens DSM 1968]|uniref:Phenylalanine--tRNA ligase beta subunit n=1 Tax=Ascoidea rubescens DSM 1968 TaxID=1344418 RepID=A0A1D2VJM2_9ASCO|nr:phenylalanyl-tRNA synthetase [Ascoidea rubescens DSM 1968]ODV61707.1 phenylalanyl-tRNA synthetase [Ascoidea rubescens DSM 1968]